MKARLQQQGMTQADLARVTGKHPNAISRSLNGLPEGGKIPPIWEAILSALGLTLTAVPLEEADAPNSSPAEPEGSPRRGRKSGGSEAAPARKGRGHPLPGIPAEGEG